MFNAFYSKDRFQFIHDELLMSGLIEKYNDKTLIHKTGCFYSKNLNVYIDTSDGVNEDLGIYEYCGRIKRVIKDSKGKKFLYFKSAYSSLWTKNIEELASKNNGKVIPFFKWSFNKDFYKHVLGNREGIKRLNSTDKKEYELGVFFGNKPYFYPNKSENEPLISWSDHQKFNLEGKSKNTGLLNIKSRQDIIEKLNESSFSVLHTSKDYLGYIKDSFKCKVIINPPGIGEYTSRMVDQTYLGNCIVLRSNSYDNGLTWKQHIPEVNFNGSDWERELKEVIDNYKYFQRKCASYYEDCWQPKNILRYLTEKIEKI